MMSVKEFDSNFGFIRTQDEEMGMFVKMVSKIYTYLKSNIESTDYTHLFECVCYQVGVNPHFNQNLRLITAIFQSLKNFPHSRQLVNKILIDALENSTTDLGVRWSKGVFYPGGENLLDGEQVEHSLTWLQNHPNESKDIRMALENYDSGRLSGVVENFYLAMEGLGRKLLINKQTLLNNKTELLRLLGFSKYWGNILSAYIMQISSGDMRGKKDTIFKHRKWKVFSISHVSSSGSLFKNDPLIPARNSLSLRHQH